MVGSIYAVYLSIGVCEAMTTALVYGHDCLLERVNDCQSPQRFDMAMSHAESFFALMTHGRQNASIFCVTSSEMSIVTFFSTLHLAHSICLIQPSHTQSGQSVNALDVFVAPQW